MRTYLSDSEMNDLLTSVKELRKGQTLNQYAKAPYLVIVDGQYHWIKTIPSLKKFLSSCYFPTDSFSLFRNVDKGVTINLDK